MYYKLSNYMIFKSQEKKWTFLGYIKSTLFLISHVFLKTIIWKNKTENETFFVKIKTMGIFKVNSKIVWRYIIYPIITFEWISVHCIWLIRSRYYLNTNNHCNLSNQRQQLTRVHNYLYTSTQSVALHHWQLTESLLLK